MDPMSSNHPLLPPDHHTALFQPTQAYADRVLRALEHRLLLLHRSDSNFYVLGATGNVYIVNVSTNLTCTCPDRAIPCKHILFVLIKVLGVSLDDSCLRRQTLRPSQLDRLLTSPSSPESLAGPMLRERFHQVFFLQGTTIEEGGTGTCPICLEEMRGGRLVGCSTCRNVLHEECLMMWKRSQRRRRSVSCVICRSRWRDRRENQDSKYLNLGGYINDDNAAADDMNPQTNQ